jgi:hypothetical protein
MKPVVSGSEVEFRRRNSRMESGLFPVSYIRKSTHFSWVDCDTALLLPKSSEGVDPVAKALCHFIYFSSGVVSRAEGVFDLLVA